jgi:four helix bundle protein
MENNLSKRLMDFGAGVLELSENLGYSIEVKAIRSQLTRSATSVGANYQESQSASSRPDFINKIQISLKELREAIYWLQLVQRVYAKGIEIEKKVTPLLDEGEQLVKILNSCALTAKQNLKKG